MQTYYLPGATKFDGPSRMKLNTVLCLWKYTSRFMAHTDYSLHCLFKKRMVFIKTLVAKAKLQFSKIWQLYCFIELIYKNKTHISCVYLVSAFLLIPDIVYSFLVWIEYRWIIGFESLRIQSYIQFAIISVSIHHDIFWTWSDFLFNIKNFDTLASTIMWVVEYDQMANGHVICHERLFLKHFVWCEKRSGILVSPQADQLLLIPLCFAGNKTFPW